MFRETNATRATPDGLIYSELCWLRARVWTLLALSVLGDWWGCADSRRGPSHHQAGFKLRRSSPSLSNGRRPQ